MSIVARCILPKCLSGCECDVIYINTDHTFKLSTLLEALEKKLSNNYRELLNSILDRFHLFTSVSLADCDMALQTLLHFPSKYCNIGMVIIDDIGAMQFESKIHSKNDLKPGDCVHALKQIIQKYSVIILLSNFLQPLSDKNYFKSWLKLVKYRFKLDDIHSNTFIHQIFPESRTLALIR